VPLTTAASRDLRDCLRRSLAVHLEVKVKSQKFLDEITAAGAIASVSTIPGSTDMQDSDAGGAKDVQRVIK
jgi:hypothetical protein